MNEALDARWFGDYVELSRLANNVDTALRSPQATAQREQFAASGTLQNPDLRPEVDPEYVNEQCQRLQALADQIDEYGPEPVVRGAYLPRISELIANLRMLRASATGDTESFIQANSEVFGEPDPVILGGLFRFFHVQADESLQSPHSSVRDAARRVQDVLPDGQEMSDLWIPQSAFVQVKAFYADFFDTLMHDISLPDTFGKEVSFPAARQAMRNMGFDYEVVPQKAGVTTMSVNHEDEQFKIPEDARYAAIRFTALLGHELRVHIEERVQGELQPLHLLCSGLRGALRGSEAKGIIPEEVLYDSLEAFMGTPRFAALAQRYVAIGLARGVDGNGPRDFVEVFSIMNAVSELAEITAEPKDVAAAQHCAFNKTWQLLANRTLRGWTGRGAAAVKDSVYIPGNAEALRTLAANPHIFPYLHIGKYDIAQDNHWDALREIGSVPTDLIINR